MRCFALLFIFSFADVCRAQDHPDPRELLLHSGDAIKKYSSYQIHSLSIIETRGGMNNRMQLPTVISVRRPDHLRIESENEAAGMIVVSNSEHTYIYLTPQNKYIKRAAVSLPDSTFGETGILKNVPDITKFMTSVELTGEKTMEIDGKEYDCWVLEAHYNSINLPEQQMTISNARQTSWISKTLGMTLQNSFTARLVMGSLPEPVEMTQATTTMELKLNPVLPDSLFVFTPPEGAKQTADWTLPGMAKPDVEGKPAPALVAKSLDGADIDLLALRGKVVLLDFWATWCGPCKRDLPEIEKLYKEFRAKGFVVLGITAGEKKEIVDKYVKTTGLSWPVAPLDPGHEIWKALSINAFPTLVLIGRTGNVVSYEVGARGPAGLRTILAKAGLNAAPKPAPAKPPAASQKPQ